MSAFDELVDLVLDRERTRFADAEFEMLTTLRQAAPLDTGATRDSVAAIRPITSGSEWSVDMVATTPQAFYTDQPDKAPDFPWIYPSAAKMLHWIDAQGDDAWAKRVRVYVGHRGWFSDTVLDWPALLESA